MSELELIIGNKNYSSWSLRPWLVLRHAGIPFTETRLALFTDEWCHSIARYSPSGKVPVLRTRSLAIWDSLAICEYVNERFPEAELWPEETDDRALARSVSAEMHSGFGALREALPMNCRLKLSEFGIEDRVRCDIDRVCAIWRETRSRFAKQGAWLFGRFSIADAMYAPVALRFSSYAVELAPPERAYVDTVLEHPAVREWVEAARRETEVIESEEVAV